MSGECCKSGHAWQGKPKGSEQKLANLDAYITGDSKERAVLLVPDIYGWTLNNSRLLADAYAEKLNATVYAPDFYDGEIVHPDTLRDPERQKNFDMGEWAGRNSAEKRWPEVKTCALALKAEYPKVGAVGFCWGGWACLRLAADPSLIDAVSTAHPALMEKSDFDNVKVPVQLIAPEDDFTFTPEMKAYSLEALPKTGVQWEYIFFAGYKHGFASRGDLTTEKGVAGLERAKRSVINFFNEFL